MAGITLKNIYKIYDNNVTAVKDFNLQIEDREFIVFVGPSGCGKSTTLRMVAGLEEISKGDFYIDEIRMNDVAPKDRDIAMVFQNYALYPHMSVYDNMAFGLKLRKIPKAEIKKRVEDAARILGLEPYLTRKPKALSGGQRQRVALGRAIVRDAKVFLMDEPLSNLDAKLRVQMRTEISKLHQRLNTTMIYVTHDQTEAMTMATRIVVMKDGIIQQIGTPKEVYQCPENMFVASFIGAPAMNFLNGKIQENQFISETNALELPESYLRLLKENGYNEKEVVIGIRPEDIYVNKKDQQDDSLLQATVEVVELMGAETLLYLTVDGNQLIAKVDTSIDVQVGTEVSITVDKEKLHFFDRESEERVK